jgi:WD40 repeat protein
LFQVAKISQSFLGRWINYLPRRLASSLLGLLPATIVALSSVYALNPSPLHLEKEIPLPGVEGRIDHFSADVLGQRLFVAALENGTVEVLDIRRGERSAEIKGLSEPQGLYYSFQNGELYVASGADGTLRIYDGNSLILRQTLEFGDDADTCAMMGARGRSWWVSGVVDWVLSMRADKRLEQFRSTHILNLFNLRKAIHVYS